jgi:guanylate kinase
VVSGPSGVGKGAVLNRLRREVPRLWVSTSVTTRPPRLGEVDGERYRFVDDESFDQLLARGELLEWNEFDRHRYGTPKAPVLDRLSKGGLVILELDPEGALRFRQSFPEARLIFLAPPSWEELRRRLAKRGTESEDVIRRRLAIARNELRLEQRFDRVLVNDSVDAVVGELLPEVVASHVRG